MYPLYLINSLLDNLADKYMLFCCASGFSMFSNCSPSESFTLIAELNQTMLICIMLVKSSDFCIDMTAAQRIIAFSWIRLSRRTRGLSISRFSLNLIRIKTGNRKTRCWRKGDRFRAAKRQRSSDKMAFFPQLKRT